MMTSRQTIDIYAALADMKDVDYKTTLAITALIDVLVAKGVITRDELSATAQRLDASVPIEGNVVKVGGCGGPTGV